ncbi:hypothetical protein HK102_010264 [Quaeritorhiza haematococci]|nr:hypothetical protein HK102_010264 [Quaeritorhiza haematococci]
MRVNGSVNLRCGVIRLGGNRTDLKGERKHGLNHVVLMLRPLTFPIAYDGTHVRLKEGEQETCVDRSVNSTYGVIDLGGTHIGLPGAQKSDVNHCLKMTHQAELAFPTGHGGTHLTVEQVNGLNLNKSANSMHQSTDLGGIDADSQAMFLATHRGNSLPLVHDLMREKSRHLVIDRGGTLDDFPGTQKADVNSVNRTVNSTNPLIDRGGTLDDLRGTQKVDGEQVNSVNRTVNSTNPLIDRGGTLDDLPGTQKADVSRSVEPMHQLSVRTAHGGSRIDLLEKQKADVNPFLSHVHQLAFPTGHGGTHLKGEQVNCVHLSVNSTYPLLGPGDTHIDFPGEQRSDVNLFLHQMHWLASLTGYGGPHDLKEDEAGDRENWDGCVNLDYRSIDLGGPDIDLPEEQKPGVNQYVEPTHQAEVAFPTGHDGIHLKGQQVNGLNWNKTVNSTHQSTDLGGTGIDCRTVVPAVHLGDSPSLLHDLMLPMRVQVIYSPFSPSPDHNQSPVHPDSGIDLRVESTGSLSVVVESQAV